MWLLLPVMASGQTILSASAALPDAPEPQIQRAAQTESSADSSQQAITSSSLSLSGVSSTAVITSRCRGTHNIPATATDDVEAAAALGTAGAVVSTRPAQACTQQVNPFQRFLSTSLPHPMSGGQKFKLAVKDVIDPFNLITVVGISAIDVGQNSHSPYGPGMRGFGWNAGVSFSQDMTGEFFGTFLIPAIMRQDPHYHRMPHSSIPMRACHAIIQTFVTQGDNGRPMFNWANLPGFLIEDEISNLYVPGRHTNMQSTTARVTIGLATVPIGNFITEFLPDVAKRVNFHVVFLQRIVNQVSRQEGGGPGSQ